MPQIYNLGGMSIQKIEELRVDMLSSSNGRYNIMELHYNNGSVLWRNVRYIHTSGGRIINAEKIQESPG
jgi:hypothetical protein